MEEENIRDDSSCSDSTDADWIRNWLFSGLKESEQNYLIDHWKKIEEKFQISPDWIGYFIYDYVILKSATSEYRQQTYSEDFKEELKKLLISHTKENFESMLRYAEFYIDYVLANNLGYNSKFKEHRSLRFTGYTPAILIMELHDLLVSNKLSEETYKKILSILESYRVRLAVTGKPNHWEIFYKMTPLKGENDPLKSFLNAVKEIHDSNPQYAFPDNDSFRKKFKEIDFYDSNNLSYDWCRLILYRLENYNRDIQFIPPEHYYQIEHIMPQTIEGTKWECILGENHKDLHREWCNRIGNLTLVPSINLNSILSNKSYEDKKKIAKSYIKIETQFQLNKCVWEKENWTKNEIEERGDTLAEKAVEIWPNLQTEFNEILSQ